jgi:hypothetical protein
MYLRFCVGRNGGECCWVDFFFREIKSRFLPTCRIVSSRGIGNPLSRLREGRFWVAAGSRMLRGIPVRLVCSFVLLSPRSGARELNYAYGRAVRNRQFVPRRPLDKPVFSENYENIIKAGTITSQRKLSFYNNAPSHDEIISSRMSRRTFSKRRSLYST